MRRPAAPAVLPAALLLAAPAWCVAQEADAEPRAEVPAVGEQGDAGEPAWTVLFDGKTLTNWTPTDFGGGGEVAVEDGAIVLPFGNNLTGVTLTGEAAKALPKVDYVVELEAKRVSGSDFFCGLTLPVPSHPDRDPAKSVPSHATIILGGWGGGLVGMSSIDGLDAARNETTTFRRFETGTWYRLRVAVTDDSVVATLDGEPLFAADIRDEPVGMRSETNLSRPLGVASFATTAAVRNVRVRKLSPGEVEKADAAVPRMATRGSGPFKP